MNFRHIICFAAVFCVVLNAVAAAGGQWTQGMDDDAGKAAVTSVTNLPAADYEGARKIYTKRDRLFTTSLDGTWAFKLVKGLDTPDELKGWNEPGYDTREWEDIAVPGNWETQGFPDYDGFAWYRIAFDAPKKCESNAVELNFGGVDEEAWVWLNGTFVGQHAVGVSGWDKPFQLDVTDEVRWGEHNLLVVRVFDARMAGGIWKPIKLDILR